MRWVWILIWLILLLVQIALHGVRTVFPRPTPELSIAADREDLDLARKTNRVWGTLLDAQTSAPRAASSGVSTNQLMEREEWLIRLDEVQVELIRLGNDVQILDDLEKWLLVWRKTKEDLGKVEINRYLADLFSWLESFQLKQEGVQINGLRLEPGMESDYPSLYFEIEGGVLPMGSCLLEATRRSTSWKVQEIDLYRDEKSDTWWIQGSCTYTPEGFR